MRAMEALHKLAALSPSERANCEAALQSLNNNAAHRTSSNTRTSNHKQSQQRQMNHVKSQNAIQFPDNALSLQVYFRTEIKVLKTTIQVQLFNTQPSPSPFTPTLTNNEPVVQQPEFDLKYPVSTASPVPSSVSTSSHHHPAQSPPVMGDLKSRHLPPSKMKFTSAHIIILQFH